MSDEKRSTPEIEHGPAIDRGLENGLRSPPPCSKRLQDGSRYGFCTKPDKHQGACEGPLSEPPKSGAKIVVKVHIPKP